MTCKWVKINLWIYSYLYAVTFLWINTQQKHQIRVLLQK